MAYISLNNLVEAIKELTEAMGNLKDAIIAEQNARMGKFPVPGLEKMLKEIQTRKYNEE